MISCNYFTSISTMAPVRNTRVLFNSIPQGYPVLGETTIADHSQTLDLEKVPLAGGKVLAKTLSISVDPYLRNKMCAPEKAAYHQPFEIGKPLYNYAVVKILRSENPRYKAGDCVYGVFDWAEYQVFSEGRETRVLPPDSGIPWSVYVGVAGMPGQTAYYGWKEVANAKKGETIYISTAAGPVGSVVVQLAKQAGLKVIASAGQEAKLQFLRDLGADVVFNYKTKAVDDVLKEHGPVDIFWDHVGGRTTDTVLTHMNTFGRVILIGAISGYNDEQPEPITNFPQILFKRLTVRGLIMLDHEEEYREDFYATIPAQIACGEIKYTESIVRSLDEAPQLLLDVQKGENIGKAVVILADE